MVYIALCALILGIIFGQFVLDSTWHDLCSELADYVLYLLMFSVGISVGMNESIFDNIIDSYRCNYWVCFWRIYLQLYF